MSETNSEVDETIKDAIKVEREILTHRQTFFKEKPISDDIIDNENATNDEYEPVIGLALSGGGIRSATFSLGLLQALSKHQRIPKIDYISTVSGGSYIGSFFGAMFIPPEKRGDASENKRERAFYQNPFEAEEGRNSVRVLRDFGRYLTPGGTSDLMLGIAISARNLMAVQVVLGLLPLLGFISLILISAVSSKTEYAFPAALFPDFLPWPVTMLIVLTYGHAAGYWFTRRERVDPNLWIRISRNGTVIAATFALMIWGIIKISTCTSLFPSLNNWLYYAPWLSSSVLFWLVAPPLSLFIYYELRYGRVGEKNIEAGALQAEDGVRSHMSRRLSDISQLTIVSLIVLVIMYLGDKLGNSILNFSINYESVNSKFVKLEVWGGLYLAIKLFWPFILPPLPALLTWWAYSVLKRQGKLNQLFVSWRQTVLGILVAATWLVVWSAVAVLMFAQPSNLAPLVVAWAVLVVVILIINESYTFLNLSSLSTLYASRLKRAYIGASNPKEGDAAFDVDRTGDLVPMSVYYPDKTSLGGPLHLINVTVAQTVSDGSNIVAYDRKGKPMHVGPAGIIYEGIRPGSTTLLKHRPCTSDAKKSGKTDVCTHEDLPLSVWTAISGAAASTAIGAQTTIGLSLLAMMANVRLGYWWKAVSADEVKKSKKHVFDWLSDSVYGYLLNELMGSFRADKRRRRWYLTDGGHFDNSGAYPLLQRRLPFIIVSDNGADPDYEMSDIVRLVNLARTDLNTKICFLNGKEIGNILGSKSELGKVIGPFSAIANRPGKQTDTSDAYRATLARVEYPDAPDGLMMIIKPRVCPEDAPELLAYRKRSGRLFPQQTTADQFFDEDQWEAYRQLGFFIGDRLFRDDPGKWSPGKMVLPVK